MAKIKFKVDESDLEKVDQDSANFVLPPKGYYVLAIKEANPGFSKTDGVEDKKKPRLEVICEIVGVGTSGEAVTENYGNIWEYISFSKDSGWKRGEMLWALGYIDSKEAAEVDIDPEELIGMQFLARLKHDNSGDEPRAKIAKWLRYADGDTEAAFGDGGGDEGGDVFGGDEGGTEYLTAEGLGELDMKELGVVAKEFDLDPNEFLVKVKGKLDLVKTKDAVIAAILEAQGAPGEDEGGDEESPF